jgi:speckle-type POZ protein
VVFEVGGERFAVHRCVLGARSPVISAELLGVAPSGTESDAGVVRVDGVKPWAFKSLLRYAYTDALPEVDKEEADGMHRVLLVAADMYRLERLKLICDDKLCQTIDVGTVQTAFALAEKLDCHVLKEACLGFMSH